MGSETALTRLYEAASDGQAWTLPLDAVDPAGADDFIAYIKNTGDDSLVIARLVGVSLTGADSTIEICRVTGTAAGTPILSAAHNLKYGSGQGAQPSGSVRTSLDVTGLTIDGTPVYHFDADISVDFAKNHEFPGGIWIPTGQAIALRVETGTGIFTGNIEFYREWGGR